MLNKYQFDDQYSFTMEKDGVTYNCDTLEYFISCFFILNYSLTIAVLYIFCYNYHSNKK